VTKGSTSQSTDIIANMTLPNGAADGDLWTTNAPGVPVASISTAAFQAQSSNNTWLFVGYITNRVDSPQVKFAYSSGTAINATTRWYFDAVRFEYVDPCTGVAPQV